MKTSFMMLLAGLFPLLLSTHGFSIGEVNLLENAPILSKARQQQIMIVRGSQIPDLLGLPIEKIVLLSKTQGGLRRIPFQFDEVDTLGFSHFDTVKTPLDGEAGRFDKNDKLVFLLKDAGDYIDDISSVAADNHMLSEIEIETKNGNSYVYAALQTRRRSKKNRNEIETPRKPYVSFNRETGLIATDFYSLKIDPNNAINWEKYTYTTFTDKSKSSILDTLKIRLHGGVFSRFTSIRIDNDNLKAKIVGIKQGSLSTILLLKTKIVIASIPVMKMLIYFEIMPQELVFNARVNIPSGAKRVLVNPRMSISLDGNDLKGSMIKTSIIPDLITHVDGRISTNEKMLTKRRFNSGNNWIWLNTQRRFDLFAFMSIPKNLDVPIKLLYQDDDTLIDKPERYQGQGPNVGYWLDELPASGTLTIKAHLVFTDGIGDMQPHIFAKEMLSLPSVNSSRSEQFAQINIW